MFDCQIKIASLLSRFFRVKSTTHSKIKKKKRKFEHVIFLTLAVMRETALGSGRVLGMLLQSCHIKLKEKTNIVDNE